ncbi:MAG: cyclic nucleotide-binding domain-containing protein [Acidobacteriota bacterium]|jgi:CRP-like cAMP-binding protein
MAQSLKEFVLPFKEGEIVFKEGDSGAEMYVVQSGRVEIYRLVGDKKHFSRIMEKGDFFGEMSLLEGIPRTTHAQALEDTELVAINAAIFDKMIKSNIEIAVRMLRKLSVRLRETTEELETAIAESGGTPGPEAPEVVAARASAREEITEEGEKPPVLAQFIAEKTLKVFPVYKEISLIGRYDPVTGIRPDIDLSDEDLKRSVSRRHAKLIFSNGSFYLAEEVGTLNGTFVNGKRIPTGVLTPLKSGSAVGFGVLKLKFVQPKQQETSASD